MCTILPPPAKSLLIPLLGLLILPSIGARQALAQQAQSQPSNPLQLRPASLPHLYWHFLIHQSILDAAAARLQAQGKDGSRLRNDLQTRLGFSDADYTPIRTGSQRLAVELKPIQEQLKALRGARVNASQMRSLIAQRDAYVASEMYNLSLELTPQNKIALEKFMAQLFAPKQIAFRLPPSAGQPEGKAGQQ